MDGIARRGIEKRVGRLLVHHVHGPRRYALAILATAVAAARVRAVRPPSHELVVLAMLEARIQRVASRTSLRRLTIPSGPVQRPLEDDRSAANTKPRARPARSRGLRIEQGLRGGHKAWIIRRLQRAPPRLVFPRGRITARRLIVRERDVRIRCQASARQLALVNVHDGIHAGIFAGAHSDHQIVWNWREFRLGHIKWRQGGCRGRRGTTGLYFPAIASCQTFFVASGLTWHILAPSVESIGSGGGSPIIIPVAVAARRLLELCQVGTSSPARNRNPAIILRVCVPNLVRRPNRCAVSEHLTSLPAHVCRDKEYCTAFWVRITRSLTSLSGRYRVVRPQIIVACARTRGLRIGKHQSPSRRLDSNRKERDQHQRP
mmetsp:Transcript_83812/g.233791  ORF Transcript_83812/g.233791 Transcript_83812/m.233791 type:complete len:375 (-) Transcript_83812:232-1356(-)